MADAVLTGREAPLADFPAGEYRTRLARFAELLRRAGLDGAVVLSEVNHRYLSGHWSKRWDYSRNATVVTADGRIGIVVSGLELAQAEASSWVEDVRSFDYGSARRSHLLTETIAETCRELGLAEGQVGLELGEGHAPALAPDEVAHVRAALPRARWADASLVLTQARVRKSEAEVAALREAAEVTHRAREATYARVEPGLSERDVYQLVTSELFAHGAERLGYVLVKKLEGSFGYGARTFAPGDVLYMDVGAVVRGYFADVTRMASLGPAPPAVRETYRWLWEVQEQVLGVVRPGTPVAEVARTLVRALERLESRGVEPSRLTAWCGHGVGLEIIEAPSLSADEAGTLLEPGMTLMVEPSFLWEGRWFLTEEAVLVTDGGHELLTRRADPELRELDLANRPEGGQG